MQETVGVLSGLVLLIAVMFGLWLAVMWVVLPLYIMRMKKLLESMVENQKKFNLKYGVK